MGRRRQCHAHKRVFTVGLNFVMKEEEKIGARAIKGANFYIANNFALKHQIPLLAARLFFLARGKSRARVGEEEDQVEVEGEEKKTLLAFSSKQIDNNNN